MPTAAACTTACTTACTADVFRPFGFASVPVAAPAAAVAAPALVQPDAGMDLRLAQLLCARVCHDLIGAAGAIQTGLELLAEDGTDQADIFDLIGLSGRQLNRRLAFYRLAFGMSGQSRDSRALGEARRLAEGFLEGGRVTLRWEVDAAALGDGRLGDHETRLLLCAILVAAEGLPRGGELVVSLRCSGTAPRLAVRAGGATAAIPDAVAIALSGGAGLDAVTARTVPAYYLGLQARSRGGAIEVRAEEAAFSLRITVPAS